MAELPQNVKGMNDILPPEVAKWQFVEEKARQILDAFAYRELRTPILEYTPLFQRTVGETTEVVEKQMYTFPDRDGSSVSMRPEGTASAVRAYIARSQWNREPVTRWYYLGPMFRHERAQRGRLRQFHQIGAEVFGIPGPSVDAEMIAMLVALLLDLGLAAVDLEVAVNSLGDPDERATYREALRAYFSAHADKLDDFSRRRLESNPLRILDSKDPRVQALAASAPILLDTLGERSRQHLAAVRGHLADLGVASQVDPRLVRGLDYYTGTTFEIKAKVGGLGAQNTLAGGGRYDRLVSSLGGPEIPAIGFALGVERVLLAMSQPAESFESGLTLYVAVLGEKARAFALPLAHRLRLGGIRTEIEHREIGLKAQLKRADALRTRLALMIGDNELAAGKFVLRDLVKREQSEVRADEIEPRIRQAMD
ncbi:MAG: histidine--tRNA ligase [Deltaproteobacteria bacterium]|nr:histidine--tRNA ligase [Deltaproteobacteria bacterium]